MATIGSPSASRACLWTLLRVERNMKAFYGGVRYHSGFLRREMTVEFPVVAAFIPSLHFSEARDAAERGDGIAFVHIDGRLKERWRSSVEHDAGVGPLCFDTIVRPTTGRSVIS